MTKEHYETEMSRRARNILEKMIERGEIAKDSAEYDSVKGLKFDDFLLEDLKKGKKIDFKKVYDLFANCDEPQYSLIRLCVKLNLTEEEAHEIIKKRFTKAYGPGDMIFYKKNPDAGKYLTRRLYPNWCSKLEITPDKNFPDWD
ncbi:MAG: hypothetical protein AABW81_00020 [Nanoarchaeota archaeon]